MFKLYFEISFDFNDKVYFESIELVKLPEHHVTFYPIRNYMKRWFDSDKNYKNRYVKVDIFL